MRRRTYWKSAWGSLLGVALSLVACGTDESSPSDGVGASGVQFLQLNPYGLTPVEAESSLGEYTLSFRVERQGKDAEACATARLTAWGEAELRRYNSDEEADYELLPPSLYSVSPTDVVLEPGTSSAGVTVSFDPSAVFEERRKTGADYIVGLRLESDDSKVSSVQRDYILGITLNYPEVGFEIPPAVPLVSLQKGTTQVEIPTSFTYRKGGVNAGSPGAFSCELRVPANAAELVAGYNASNRSSYELLPEENYDLGGEIRYGEGDTRASGALSVLREGLGPDVYLLPLTLGGFSDESVAYGGETYYAAFSQTYSNPVLDGNHPDPSVLRTADGDFYLYCTESGGDDGGMGIYRSADLMEWEHVGRVITGNYLSWADLSGGNGDLWAPEARLIDGRYTVYFSVSSWGGLEGSKIGVATSHSPSGPFTDSGKALITYEDLGVLNSIDPFYWEEDGRKYLFWGSFHGLYATELTDDGLSVRRNGDGSPTLLRKVAGSAFEATCIYKRNGYYYLFASVGSCCEGVNSTYRVVVGRSESLLGPYVDHAGGRMLDNKYREVVKGNSRWVGPGHNSRIIVDDAGTEWMIYHGRPMPDADVRSVLLDRLLWTDDGWPYVLNGEPSEGGLIPFFE